MSRAAKIFSGILATLIAAATGAYVLWQFHTTAGLIVGVALVLLALAIAFPMELRRGSTEFKDSVVVVVDQAEHALKGSPPPPGGERGP